MLRTRRRKILPKPASLCLPPSWGEGIRLNREHGSPCSDAGPKPGCPCPADTHLGWQQRVGVELPQLGHQLVVRVHHVLHEAARQREPVGAPIHHDALGDVALAQPPHVGVALVEQAVQALLLDEPGQGDEGEGLGTQGGTAGHTAALLQLR